MTAPLVIFDCDGVLIDSELLAVKADVACLAEEGIEAAEDDILERYVGISMAAMLADLEDRFGRKLRGDFAARHARRLEALFATELRAVAGVAAVIDGLAARRCVASSSAPARLRYALGLVGLYDRFDPHVFSATMVARGKPAPDLFLFAAAQMGADPARAIVIEDSGPGVTAAVAAGMTAIGFTGASHCRPGHADRLYAHGATTVVADMAALAPVLTGLSQRLRWAATAGTLRPALFARDRHMRCVAAVVLLALVAGCTPYLPAKGDFGTSALVPAGDIPSEYAAFNAYNPGINPLLARQICATPYQPLEEGAVNATPGKLIEERGICATHRPIIGP